MNQTTEYIQRINRVIDYIESNLSYDIQLDDLARIAGLSKFHFHRIFYSFTNESLYGFVTRLRIERSAALLLSQKKSITEIAFSCGFNDSATFSRAFKRHFFMSATEWKKKKHSKIHQDVIKNPTHTCTMKAGQTGFFKPLEVEELDFPDTFIGYIRHQGTYAGDYRLFQSLYSRLLKWAKTAGVVNHRDSRNIVLYHDSLGITENDKLRISVGITIPGGTKVSGEIGSLWISKARYLSCRFEVKNHEYGKAWTEVYRTILPQRGLQPDDGYCFEHYPPHCSKGTDSIIVEIYVPIKNI